MATFFIQMNTLMDIEQRYVLPNSVAIVFYHL